MVDGLIDFNCFTAGQAFPLFLFQQTEETDSLFDLISDRKVDNAICLSQLDSVRKQYLGATISSEDIFYYIYGLLHSSEYRELFKNNLVKDLPRIPWVSDFE
ncbi:MAG: hypothetical protein EBV54_06075, partial [Burkholderiaceae bacterium]|nr:hypothetical protein [Burkholderiaceae bacterium]